MNVGDKVVCINAGGAEDRLVYGNEYTILKISHGLVVLEGVHGAVFAKRFKPLSEKAEVKPKIELNIKAKGVKPKKRPFSSLPIYRNIRKKITDVNDRNIVLDRVKRRYEQVPHIPTWKTARNISAIIVYSVQPEGVEWWRNINTKLST